jgi:hypothetical protein
MRLPVEGENGVLGLAFFVAIAIAQTVRQLWSQDHFAKLAMKTPIWQLAHFITASWTE